MCPLFGFLRSHGWASMISYVPIAIFALIAVVFAVVPLVVGRFLRPTPEPTEGKLAPYECGVEPETRYSRQRFSVRYYIVAMLFLVFDVETIFLFPWAVSYRQLGLFGFIEMLIFLAILIFGYFYAWRRGALEWA